MKTYISILRGINVSGQKKILMADLKLLYEELGFQNVQTYIQSGNVVFEYPKNSVSELQQLISNKIKNHYGFEVPNLILLPQGIKKILDDNPFKQIEKMYFIFLTELPEQENIQKLATYNFENEFYELHGKVIYFYCPDGYGRAKMNNNFFEKQLKVMATTRNLNTVKKLLGIATS